MSATQQLLRFGVFELNLGTEELRKDGTPVKLAPQPFAILALLASRSGQLVTREDIQKQIWGDGTYVDFEHGLNQCIKQIRTALSDNPDRPAYVETVPRRGYRFLAPVVSKTVAAPPPKVVESKSGMQPLPAAVAVPKGTPTEPASGVREGVLPRSRLEPAGLAGQDGFALSRAGHHRRRWHGRRIQGRGLEAPAGSGPEVSAGRGEHGSEGAETIRA